MQQDPPALLARCLPLPRAPQDAGDLTASDSNSAHSQINGSSQHIDTSSMQALPTSMVSSGTQSHVQQSQQFESSFSQLRISLAIAYKELVVGNKIGQGSFGMVNQGTYKNTLVAIKQLMNQHLNEAAVEEFRREVTIMSKLDSPYIVKLIGACFEPNSYSLVLEYMPQGSLYSLLNSPKHIEWNIRYQLAIDVGEGLAYLHEYNIIHGDMKSMNVLLYTDSQDNYRAKISDFGLAKIKLNSSVSTLVGAHAGGTTRWMAPELFEENAKNSKHADVFSYAIILWEIGARKIPYAATRNEAVPILVMQEKREKIVPETPPKMAHLIGLCWKQRAQDRPPMNKVVKELKDEQATIYRAVI